MTQSTEVNLNKKIRIFSKKFDDLTAREVYDILALRNVVFVVEQNAVYNDTDYADLESIHFMIYEGDSLASYLRLIPEGIKYAESSIGRVVTHSEFRIKGYSRMLLEQSMQLELQRYPDSRGIRISAQSYLQKFYGSLGFIICSEEYLEDGLPHVEMIFTR